MKAKNLRPGDFIYFAATGRYEYVKSVYSDNDGMIEIRTDFGAYLFSPDFPVTSEPNFYGAMIIIICVLSLISAALYGPLVGWI